MINVILKLQNIAKTNNYKLLTELEDLIYGQIRRVETRIDKMDEDIEQLGKKVKLADTKISDIQQKTEGMIRTDSKIATVVQKMQMALAQLDDNNNQLQNCKSITPVIIYFNISNIFQQRELKSNCKYFERKFKFSNRT